MKYIQMFESWLNEASNAKFDLSKPQSFPMLKVTQGDLYSGNEENFKKTLASLYSRSVERKQTSDSDPFTVVNFLNLSIKSIDIKNNKMKFEIENEGKGFTEFKIVAAFTNVMDEMGYDIKSESGLAELKNVFLVFPKSIDKSKVMSKSEDGSIKVSTDSAMIVILPKEPYDKEELAITQDSICIAKSAVKDCVIGQSCSYIALEFKIPGALSASEWGDDKYFASQLFKKA